jgi:hypothetical protein
MNNKEHETIYIFFFISLPAPVGLFHG